MLNTQTTNATATINAASTTKYRYHNDQQQQQQKQQDAEGSKKQVTPNLYQMLTEGGVPASPMLMPTVMGAGPTMANSYAWMQASRTKRRRHNSPLMNSLSADPALMASAGIEPGSLSSSGGSSYLSSPSTGMAMMSLGSPQMMPKMMIAPLSKSSTLDERRHGGEARSRRNSSPLILPLDITPEERADSAWFQEMLKARAVYLEDTKDLDWENITVIELKRLLRKYGMNSTGKKTVLIERVQDATGRLLELDVGDGDVHVVVSAAAAEQDFTMIDELVAAAEEKSREESHAEQHAINAVQPNKNAPS